MRDDLQVVTALLTAAGLPADDREIEQLAAAYPAHRAALDRLYEIPDPDVTPAVVYRCRSARDTGHGDG